jgi:nucleotide-binding universal stress UspA family protein
MAYKKDKKLLLAIDGSKRGLLTVRHAARFDPFKEMQIKLFHVFSSVPESYWDLEREPKSVKAIKHVRAWETQQKKEIQDYMDQAKRILFAAGFDNEKIVIVIHKRKKGVARDIIAEAKKGYDFVVTRRRGLGIVRGINMGSVAAKLLDKVSFAPLVISGRKIPNDKVLVALDGSDASMRAVDIVGDTLSNFASKVCLLHVIRSKGMNGGFGPLFSPNDFSEKRAKEFISVFREAKKRLVNSGFKQGQIRTRVISDVPSRAAIIAEQAKKGDYLRIVMGRRGLSKSNQFSLGRVTYKVIRLAKESAVWVIP